MVYTTDESYCRIILNTVESRILDKSNSRCLEQCWSLDSSRYRELTVFDIEYLKLFDERFTLQMYEKSGKRRLE